MIPNTVHISWGKTHSHYQTSKRGTENGFTYYSIPHCTTMGRQPYCSSQKSTIDLSTNNTEPCKWKESFSPLLSPHNCLKPTKIALIFLCLAWAKACLTCFHHCLQSRWLIFTLVLSVTHQQDSQTTAIHAKDPDHVRKQVQLRRQAHKWLQRIFYTRHGNDLIHVLNSPHLPLLAPNQHKPKGTIACVKGTETLTLSDERHQEIRSTFNRYMQFFQGIISVNVTLFKKSR